MKRLLFLFFVFTFHAVSAQQVEQKLASAWNKLISDSQLSNAIASLYVVDASTGKVVFDKNGNFGLAPASTQKIITSVTAFELLGSDYRYKTDIGYNGSVANGVLNGNLIVKGSGDPTFGSWRWETTKEENIINEIIAALSDAGIKKINGKLLVDLNGFEKHQMPDGWIWQDAGNYYGAGPSGLNWRENQYDMFLQSGKKIGDEVKVIKTIPALAGFIFESVATAAGAGTGDNAYIYLPVGDRKVIVKGTIPVNENGFKISGAMPDPVKQFCISLANALVEKKISNDFATQENFLNDGDVKIKPVAAVISSPGLDSIIYWFNRRSINLYGESLLQTIGKAASGKGTSKDGLKTLNEFWKKNGLKESELNMYDGSGLSPLNRVTTASQVKILLFAKGRPWFNAFYHALPEYNGMKMKSGTISDVKGFCGYQRSRDGKEYVFSFLVNNYNGRASELVNKMYTVLNNLK